MNIKYEKYGKTVQHMAMTHNWNLIISEAACPEALDGFKKSGLFDASGAFNSACVGINGLPNSNYSDGILSGNIRGVPFHQAASRESSVKEMTLTLNDFYDYRIFRYFECWKSMAVNRFDWSQNLDAMVPNGISIAWYDTDRQTATLVYHLYDTVCTKCSLSNEYASESQFARVTVGLKCGYYEISTTAGPAPTLGDRSSSIELLKGGN